MPCLSIEDSLVAEIKKTYGVKAKVVSKPAKDADSYWRTGIFITQDKDNTINVKQAVEFILASLHCYYEGPGGSFASDPSIRTGKFHILVKQYGGMDI